MAEIRVRNLEEWVVEAFRLRARRNGHSLEGELRELLRQEALRRKNEIATEMLSLRDDLRKKDIFTDALAALHESRDGRA